MDGECCTEDGLRNNIEGDVIETGVWKGTACAARRTGIDEFSNFGACKPQQTQVITGTRPDHGRRVAGAVTEVTETDRPVIRLAGILFCPLFTRRSSLIKFAGVL